MAERPEMRRLMRNPRPQLAVEAVLAAAVAWQLGRRLADLPGPVMDDEVLAVGRQRTAAWSPSHEDGS